MIVKSVYSPDVYKKIMNANQDKKDDIYRYELMLPFKGKSFLTGTYGMSVKNQSKTL